MVDRRRLPRAARKARVRWVDALLIALLTKALDLLVERVTKDVPSQQEMDGSTYLDSDVGPVAAITDLAWHLNRATTLSERQTIADRIMYHANCIVTFDPSKP